MKQNITMNLTDLTYHKPNNILTYDMVLDKFSDGFLNLIFKISIVLVLYVLYNIFLRKRLNNEWLNDSIDYLALPVSLFLLVLIIGYNTGWYI